MNIPTFLANASSAEWVLNLAIQSMAIMALGWILTLMFRRSSAPFKSGILLALMALLALWPMRILVLKPKPVLLSAIPLASSDLNPALSSAETIGPVPFMETRENAGQQTVQQRDRASDPSMIGSGLSRLRLADFARAALNGFGMIWIAGIIILLGRLFHGITYLAGFRNSLREIRDKKFVPLLEEVRSAFPAGKIPSLCESPAVRSPLAFGFRRPMIVLPQTLSLNLSTDELRSILLHETAHLRHRDQFAGILQRLITALYWWNPLARTLSAKFSVAREQVSDNYGIMKNGARTYAECLVALAQKTSLLTRLPFAVGMATPHISLEERIMDIVSKNRDIRIRLKRTTVIALASAAFLLAAIVGSYAFTLSPGEETAKIIPLPADIQSQTLTVDKDWLYIRNFKGHTDSKDPIDIKIFSMKDLSLKKTFGRRGQGPGEFLISPGNINIVGDSLWIDDARKIVVFSKEGVFKEEIAFPTTFWLLGFPLLPVENNFVAFVAERSDLQNGIHRYFGRLYDRDFDLVKQFYDEMPFVTPPPPPPPPPPAPPGKPKETPVVPQVIKEDYFTIPDCIDFAVADNKIFLADTRKGFHISVFNAHGNLIYEIHKDFEKLRVPRDFQELYLKRIHEKARWLPKVANFKFREFYPAFMGFRIANNKIYIFTYAEKDGFHELIIMNLKGDILKKAFTFPLGPSYDTVYGNFSMLKGQFDILADKIYYLTHNEVTGSLDVRILEIYQK